MYVGNYGSDTLSVIDTNNNTVEQTISVGRGPSGIAYDPVDKRMYVAIYGVDEGPKSEPVLDNKVLVIDTSTNRVEHIIPVGYGPQFIAYDQIHKRMYVLISGSPNPRDRPHPGNAIDIIDI